MRSHSLDNDLFQIIMTIRRDIENPINIFLNNHKKNKLAISNLVMTLKYWANPNGDYQVALEDNHLLTYFSDLQKIIKNPKMLLDNIDFSKEDEQYIQKLVQIKLNDIADKLTNKYHMQESISKKIHEMNMRKNAIEWWNNKTHSEKIAIEQQYQRLSYDQHALIEKSNPPLTLFSGSNGLFQSRSDPFPYYYMCNHLSDLNFHTLEKPIRIELCLDSEHKHTTVSFMQRIK